MNLLAEDPAYTYQELMEKSGLGRKAIANRIKSLKAKGIISLNVRPMKVAYGEGPGPDAGVTVSHAA